VLVSSADADRDPAAAYAADAHKELTMSTVEATREPQSGRTRLRIRLLALGALIAIGATALILTLGHSDHAARPHAAIHAEGQYQTAPPAVPSVPAGYFRDPATHALVRVSPEGRNAWPSLASVLAPLTPRARRYVLGLMSLTPAQLAAAYGTVK
jgi:hypothetical protein